MKRTILIGTVAALTMLAPAGRDLAAQGGGGSPAVIYEWNKIIQDTIGLAGGGAGAPRLYALTHIAMFDAVNAIEREFQPYHVRLGNPVNGSARAAAAKAAHDVIVALNPAGTADYDALLTQQLGAEGAPGFEKHGVEIGAQVAAAVLAWRHDARTSRMSRRAPEGRGSSMMRGSPSSEGTAWPWDSSRRAASGKSSA